MRYTSNATYRVETGKKINRYTKPIEVLGRLIFNDYFMVAHHYCRSRWRERYGAAALTTSDTRARTHTQAAPAMMELSAELQQLACRYCQNYGYRYLTDRFKCLYITVAELAGDLC